MLYESYKAGGIEGLKKYIADEKINIHELNDKEDDMGLLYTEDPNRDYDFVKYFMDNGIVPTEKDLANAYFYSSWNDLKLATAMWEANPNMDINKLKFSMDDNSPQQLIVRYLDDIGICDPSAMFQHMMNYGKMNMYKNVWIYSEQREMQFIEWIMYVDTMLHPNGKNIIKIRKMLD